MTGVMTEVRKLRIALVKRSIFSNGLLAQMCTTVHDTEYILYTRGTTIHSSVTWDTLMAHQNNIYCQKYFHIHRKDYLFMLHILYFPLSIYMDYPNLS